MGENTPFAKQSRKKERDNVHDKHQQQWELELQGQNLTFKPQSQKEKSEQLLKGPIVYKCLIFGRQSLS